MDIHSQQVRLMELDQMKDHRGWLVALEENSTLPISFARIFYMGGMSPLGVRGAHANRNSSFFMVAVSGSCIVETNDGKESKSYKLNSYEKGLFIPKMIWKEMRDFTEDCVLIVLSDKIFDPNEYISDFDSYTNLIKIERR